MATFTYTEQLKIVHCTCGIPFAIPEDLNRQALDNRGPNGKSIYCPLGHHWYYTGKTDAEKLQEQLDTKERQLASERARRDQAEAAAEHERNRVRGYQGALGKARKRAAKDICPAPGCKRSFVDVAKHVATCHPDLTDAPVEV